MTISRYERIIIWITSAALGVFAVACIFWIPCDQSKLLRPIPANAVLITSHRNLGPRLENMTTNVFLKAFFDSAGPALKNLRKNRYAARILASRSIMAYVPDFNQSATRGHANRLASAWSSNPALVISSWVGGWTAVMRWALWIHPPRDIAPLGDYNGRRLWVYEKPVSCFGAVNYFSFAVDEGIFIGCLSQDRSGIAYLMRNYDGRKDSILDRPQFRFTEKTPVPDQVWLRIDLPNATLDKSFFAVCSLDALENDYLAATIRFEPDIHLTLPRRATTKCASRDCLPAVLRPALQAGHSREGGNPEKSILDSHFHGNDKMEKSSQENKKMPDHSLNDCVGQNRDLAEIGKMYDCSPSVVVLFPADMVTEGFDGLTRPGGLISPAWAKAVKPIIAPSSGTNNVCLLMVFGGAYGGQFGKEPFKIAVPTVLLAVSGARQDSFRLVSFRSFRASPRRQSEPVQRLQDESIRVKQTKTAVLELLDLINLKYRLGLILNSTLPPAGQCPVYAIESISRAPLNSLPVEDQPAFAFYNDWFLLAGNSAGLRKLLLNFQSQAVPADDKNKNWLKQADSRQKKAFIWIDPGEGGKALRFALTASIIMLDADGRNPSKQNTIKILKGLRSWLESISNLKNCAAWLESEDGPLVVRLEIGRKIEKN